MYTLNCRGRNDRYQLGHGTNEHVNTPKAIELFDDKCIVDLATGKQHCVAVTQNRDIYFWGSHYSEGDLETIEKTPKVVGERSNALHVGVAAGPSQVRSFGPIQHITRL